MNLDSCLQQIRSFSSSAPSQQTTNSNIQLKFKYKWYVLPDSVYLTEAILTKYVKLFWNDVFAKYISDNPNSSLKLMTKVEYSEGGLLEQQIMGELSEHIRRDSSLLRSLLGFQHLNFEDMFVYIHNLNTRLGILQDYYR